MILDFSQTSDTTFNVDVCVIGAGAAGFSCAVTLLNSGLRVLILEGGLNVFNQQAADIHRGEVVGHPHEGIEIRERIVGGSTTTWGGQAFPFMREDFEKRSYVKSSGWPISFDVIAPYYHKAEAILGTDSSVSFDYQPWNDWRVKQPKFSSSIDLLVTKWCKIPNFAIQHSAKIETSNSVDLLRNANVVELLPTESLDSVKSLRICSLGGREGTIHARYVIAAGGALETVRLFLVSKKFGNNGLGNSHGLVGCYFQDHIAAIIGQVFPKNRKLFHEVFDPFFKKGFKYFPRLRLNPLFAGQSELLHASAQVIFGEEENEILSIAKAMMANFKRKQMPDKNVIKSLARFSKFPELVNVAFRWKIKNRGSSPKSGPIWIEIHSEQEPQRESRVTLSNKVDELGMPRICLHWTLSDLAVKTIQMMAKLVKEEFSRTNLGKVNLEPWVEGLTDDPFRWLRDTYHQAGGLRMANQEDEGVVNTSCRVFGVNNLYVASSAVFPTSSFSNPTMTTIAIAIRISETIEKLMKNQSV